MNKFRYVASDVDILINIEQIVCIDEKNQTVWLSNGKCLILKYADIWQLVEDLRNLEVGDKS